MCGNYDTDIFIASENCCACGGGNIQQPEPPTGYNGVGIGKDGSVKGYWFIEETAEQDGYYVDLYNVRIGTFNYTAGSNQQSRWCHGLLPRYALGRRLSS